MYKHNLIIIKLVNYQKTFFYYIPFIYIYNFTFYCIKYCILDVSQPVIRLKKKTFDAYLTPYFLQEVNGCNEKYMCVWKTTSVSKFGKLLLLLLFLLLLLGMSIYKMFDNYTVLKIAHFVLQLRCVISRKSATFIYHIW